jgi:hypothetical protein
MVVSFWQQINFDQFNDFNHGQDYFLKNQKSRKILLRNFSFDI